MTTALQVIDVEKRFADVVALDRACLTARSGTITAVLGPSGSGKSTLLRVVGGFERPDAGTVLIGGRDVTALPPERRGVGYVPQEGALFPHLSVLRNVGYGVGRATRRARALEVLDLVGLADLAHRMPHELSGGQQQRVAVARALAPHPELILLDEPFSALDPALRAEVREHVGRALRAVGATGVLVTHDQGEAMSWTDHLVVLAQGRVVADGDPVALYRSPTDATAARFLGEANLLPARWRAGLADTAIGPVAVQEGAGAGDGSGTVLIRPEQVLLAAADAPGPAGRVLRRDFFGHDALLTVALADGTEILARTSDPAVLRLEEVAVSVTGAAVAFRD